jgi:hypothetical protein
MSVSISSRYRSTISIQRDFLVSFVETNVLLYVANAPTMIWRSLLSYISTAISSAPPNEAGYSPGNAHNQHEETRHHGIHGP